MIMTTRRIREIRTTRMIIMISTARFLGMK
jgi:hypothetical protein